MSGNLCAWQAAKFSVCPRGSSWEIEAGWGGQNESMSATDLLGVMLQMS